MRSLQYLWLGVRLCIGISTSWIGTRAFVEKMQKLAVRIAGLTGEEKYLKMEWGTLARPRICVDRNRPFAHERSSLPKLCRSECKCNKSNEREDRTARPDENILRHRPPHVGVPKDHKQRPGTSARGNGSDVPGFGGLKSRVSAATVTGLWSLMTALPLCSVCGYVGEELGLCEAIYSCVYGCGAGSVVR